MSHDCWFSDFLLYVVRLVVPCQEPASLSLTFPCLTALPSSTSLIGPASGHWYSPFGHSVVLSRCLSPLQFMAMCFITQIRQLWTSRAINLNCPSFWGASCQVAVFTFLHSLPWHQGYRSPWTSLLFWLGLNFSGRERGGLLYFLIKNAIFPLYLLYEAQFYRLEVALICTKHGLIPSVFIVLSPGTIKLWNLRN